MVLRKHQEVPTAEYFLFDLRQQYVARANLSRRAGARASIIGARFDPASTRWGRSAPWAQPRQLPWPPLRRLFVFAPACYTTPVASNALQPRQRVDQLQTELAALSSQRRSSVLLGLEWFRQAPAYKAPAPTERRPQQPPPTRRGQQDKRPKGAQGSYRTRPAQEAPKGWWNYTPRQAPSPPPKRPLTAPTGVQPDREGIKHYNCPQPKRPTYQPPPPPPTRIRGYGFPADDGPTTPATSKSQWRPQASSPSVWRLTPPKFFRDLPPSPFGEGLPRVI